MGREVKRVALDFEWPIDVVWKGYLCPYQSTGCKVCSGSGMPPAMKKLSDDWYTHLRTDGKEGWSKHLEQADVDALVERNRLMDFTCRPRTPEQVEQLRKQGDGTDYWLEGGNGYRPTAEEVNEWAKKGFGHDAINQWICVKARAKRLGIYGDCEHCKGKGHYWCDDKFEALADEWQMTEPPAGEG